MPNIVLFERTNNAADPRIRDLYVQTRARFIDFMQKTSVTKKTHTSQDKDVPHNMGKSDLIRASDFNFLMVLGKGSFGKVSPGD